MSQDPSASRAAELAPSPDEIRERAYDIWDRNHRPNGYELEFWLMAERELKAERRTGPERDGGSRQSYVSPSDVSSAAGASSF
ncbi:DUF2934 domain-containing protein [Methylobacterium sp. P31]